MKNSVLVIFAAIAMVAATESLLAQQDADRNAQRYETRLEVQEQKYMDELIEVRSELSKVRGELRLKQFEFDMVTNRVEQLNKEIGEGGQHD